MRTVAYLQISPTHAPNGRLRGISAKRVSTQFPRNPIAGAVTLRIEIEIPDEAFTPIDVKVKVPMDALSRNADVTVTRRDEGGES